MATIFDLTEQQTEILSLLYWLDEYAEDYEEQKQRLESKLASIKGSAEHKIDFLSGIYLETRAMLEQRTEARKLAQKREESAVNAEDRIKQTIISLMATFELSKVEGRLCNVSRYQSGGSVIFNSDFSVDLLPDSMKKYIPASVEPITSEISKALKAGESIDGCELIKSNVVRFS